MREDIAADNIQVLDIECGFNQLNSCSLISASDESYTTHNISRVNV